MKDKLVGDDMDLIKRTPAEFDAIRKEDIAKWTKIVKDANIKVER